MWLSKYEIPYIKLYEGKSIIKLQIVTEKKRMGIMTYKQHLFFNVISIRRWRPSCMLGWCLRRAPTLPAWRSPPSDRLDVGRWRSRCPPFRELMHPIMDCLTWQAVHRTWAAFLCGYQLPPYLLPTNTAQRHALLSRYTYSGAPPSCKSCSVFTVKIGRAHVW
jgi:hypothetical protein